MQSLGLKMLLVMGDIVWYFFNSHQDYRSSQPSEGDKEVQILIPQPFMGTIIGTGGTKIKDLRLVSLFRGVCLYDYIQ